MNEPAAIGRAHEPNWFSVDRVEGKPMSGVRARVSLRDQEGLLIEVNIEGGTRVPPHQHEHESYCYLLQGRIRSRVGSETWELGPGDSFLHPRNVEHEAEILETSRWIEVKTPAQETW